MKAPDVTRTSDEFWADLNGGSGEKGIGSFVFSHKLFSSLARCLLSERKNRGKVFEGEL
jgi:hypothetical protein